MATINRKIIRRRIHNRIRRKVSGTAERPRLCVYFSGKHVYAQVVDDEAGRALVCAGPTAKKIDKAVFDRGGFLYHGKVKALADAAREGGLKL